MKKGDARPDIKDRTYPPQTCPECPCHVNDFQETCPYATLWEIERHKLNKKDVDNRLPEIAEYDILPALDK